MIGHGYYLFYFTSLVIVSHIQTTTSRPPLHSTNSYHQSRIVPARNLHAVTIRIKEEDLLNLAIRQSPLKSFNPFFLEGLHERIEIGDAEADVVAPGEVLGVDGRRVRAVGALGEPGLRQALDEVEEEARGGQAQPYHLEPEVGALHLLEPKNLLVELGQTPDVGGLARDVVEARSLRRHGLSVSGPVRK